LLAAVKCEGNIEDWLFKLEKGMQRAVRDKCRKCREEIDGVKITEQGTG